MKYKDREILKKRFDEHEESLDLNKLIAGIDKKRGKKSKRRIILWLLYPSLLLLAITFLLTSDIFSGNIDAKANHGQLSEVSSEQNSINHTIEKNSRTESKNTSQSTTKETSNFLKEPQSRKINDSDNLDPSLVNVKDVSKVTTRKTENRTINKKTNSEDLIIENNSNTLDEDQNLVLHPNLSFKDKTLNEVKQENEFQTEDKANTTEEVKTETQEKIEKEITDLSSSYDLLALPILLNELSVGQYKFPKLKTNSHQEKTDRKENANKNNPILTGTTIKARVNYGKYAGTFSGTESTSNEAYDLKIINHLAETQEILAGINIGNNLSFYTGISRSQLTERIDFNATYLSNQDGTFVGFIDEEQDFSNYLSAVEADPNLDKTDWDLRNYNTFSSYSIPVELAFSLKQNKLAVGVLGGLRIPLTNKYEGFAKIDGQIPMAFADMQNPSSKITLYSGFELNYSISDKTYVGLGLTGSYQNLVHSENEHPILVYAGSFTVGYKLYD